MLEFIDRIFLDIYKRTKDPNSFVSLIKDIWIILHGLNNPPAVELFFCLTNPPTADIREYFANDKNLGNFYLPLIFAR